MDIARGAITEAAKYDDEFVGTHHLLLALLAEPSAVVDALTENGVTYDQVADTFCRDVLHLREAGTRDAAGGRTHDATQVCGRAEGMAILRGLGEPGPEEWILAMLYSSGGMGFPLVLQVLGVSRRELVESLRQRGVRMPDVKLPALEP
jgi:ATP-dependent Clp protease ATP-binding subunit ClpA